MRESIKIALVGSAVFFAALFGVCAIPVTAQAAANSIEKQITVSGRVPYRDELGEIIKTNSIVSCDKNLYLLGEKVRVTAIIKSEKTRYSNHKIQFLFKDFLGEIIHRSDVVLTDQEGIVVYDYTTNEDSLGKITVLVEDQTYENIQLLIAQSFDFNVVVIQEADGSKVNQAASNSVSYQAVQVNVNEEDEQLPVMFFGSILETGIGTISVSDYARDGP